MDTNEEERIKVRFRPAAREGAFCHLSDYNSGRVAQQGPLRKFPMLCLVLWHNFVADHCSSGQSKG
ncbi:hypothetical protein SLEP1_g53140 [Rubroshorea leprosula]|uniref:Uncharacterized protein n=1 Tax=Rubroshorea leprosula TaxID=152421 RepID=A0AAV5M8H8_9ROSI|nr:hypothetical protein SLEP1_g53140 [Rubroshorea leprosula]